MLMTLRRMTLQGRLHAAAHALRLGNVACADMQLRAALALANRTHSVKRGKIMAALSHVRRINP